MKKLAIASFALTIGFLPMASVACPAGGHTASMSCADGKIWDAESRRCVISVTG